MSRVTELESGKSVLRRIGGLVVRINADGISVRRRRSRKWRSATWQQVAKLCLQNDPGPRGYTADQWADPLRTIGAKW